MMRATPYCSVSPIAMSAYMPPSTAPATRMSNARIIFDRHGRACPGHLEKGRTVAVERDARGEPGHDQALLPRGLGHDRGAHPVLLRRDAVEVVALPLAD